MAWVKYVCGRMKSDYQYSASIVYNDYPFPEEATVSQKAMVETAAQNVLTVRQPYLSPATVELEANAPTSDKKGTPKVGGQSLADLYDPLSMPPNLAAAHDALDKAVDACYGKTKFPNDAKRVAFLFELYDGLVKGGK